MFQSAINRVLNVNKHGLLDLPDFMKFQSAINRVLNVNVIWVRLKILK